MELLAYIEQGEKKVGTSRALADAINVDAANLGHAKHGRRGLPAYACVKLAQLIGEDERRVIAASELVTEKNPERRAVWLPFVQELAKRAPERAMAETITTARKVAKTTFECCPAASKLVDAIRPNG